MSTVSTQPTPPASQEQEAAVSSLFLEADPSGFTERAPALVSLLPDETLSLALARADAFAIHAALTARLTREPAGPTRDTLRALLDNRALFIMAERPPSLRSFLGSGMRLIGLPAPSQQETPFVATRAFCLFGVPLWPLEEHLVRRGRDGQIEVLGRVAGMSRSSRALRWSGPLMLGAGVLALGGLALAPFAIREVQLVNGLSRPVEVRVDGHTRLLQPGEITQETFYTLSGSYHVEAKWPGAPGPFESFLLEAGQHTVYNILGAASVQVDSPVKEAGSSLVEGRTASFESDTALHIKADWQQKLNDFISAERWREAADLAKAVFMADPSQFQTGETAAHILARSHPDEALAFAQSLARKSPDDLAVHRLARNLFLALGKRHEAYALYHASALQDPGSVNRALLEADVMQPELQANAYREILKRFPQSPEAKRAVARLTLINPPRGPYFDDPFAQYALELLDSARAQSPESVEDLELRVRAMIGVRQQRESPQAVREFADGARHTWELAVLAARTARISGPRRLQGGMRDLVPPEVLTSPERLALFDLLTGAGISKKQLKAIQPPAAHDAIALTQAVVKDLDEAVRLATAAPDPVLRRLDLETGALLALELSRRGDRVNSDRVFNSSLELMAAREPLEVYVGDGNARQDFLLLPPGLQAAAYLVRARTAEDYRGAGLERARGIDRLGGLARRALDPDYDDLTEFEDLRPPPERSNQPREFIPCAGIIIRARAGGHRLEAPSDDAK